MTDADFVAVFGRRAWHALVDFGSIADLAAGLVAQGRAAYDSNIYLRLSAEAIVHRMSEAIGRLPPEVTAAYPDIKFSLARGMRNRVAHQYDTVDYQILWQALSVDLPYMAVQVSDLLAGVPGAQDQ